VLKMVEVCTLADRRWIHVLSVNKGRHHQQIKFSKITHKPKKKVVKERKSKQEALVTIHEWTSGGELSS
jgi:hypothetical protein